MDRYSEYIDSGVFWQPLMPSCWKVVKLKYILKKLNRVRQPDAELLVCSNSGKVQKRGDSRLGLVAESDDIYQGVLAGDLLIHGMDTWHGAIAVSDLDGMCTPVVHVCESTQNKEYIALYLRNMAYEKIFKLISNGVRQNTSDFRSWQKVGVLPIPLPSIREQSKIVSYINNKILKINAYVAERERELQLFDELKQSEIANVVTKGLNPNVAMKDSGISWIGMIPEHWDVGRIKRLLIENKAKSEDGHGELLSLSQYTGIMPKSQVEKPTGMFEAESTVGYRMVRKGQFVMNIMLAWNGSYAVSNYDGIISPAYCVFDFREKCNKQYYDYLLRTKAYCGAFKTMSKGIIDSRLRLYPQYFLAFKTIFPPIEEQNEIVDYITNKVSKIETLISELTSEIDYLKELKQRIISDAVTGQINVQNI